MQSEEIRKRFLTFFEKRNHVIIPSASLVPENDPTVLFITAGMQPLVPYLMGVPHPAGKRIADIQKCVRTGDIDDIGDDTHLTFFEMLGNWSLGDYFKEDTIKWSYELLTSKEEGFGLDPKRIYVTVFAGDENVLPDDESKKIWMEVGIPENRIYYLGADANWWPNVKGEDTWTGPAGPSSEMFYDLTEEGLGDLTHEKFMQADDDQKIVEIWNDVFMAYEKQNGNIVGELKSKNIDTGAGLERITTVLQNKKSVFDTDLFEPIMRVIPDGDDRARRIVADHIRAAVCIIADGVLPSNTDRGYILRRLLRRMIFKYPNQNLNTDDISVMVDAVVGKYQRIYNGLLNKGFQIKQIIQEEHEKFVNTLGTSVKKFNNACEIAQKNNTKIPGEVAFDLHQSFGLPIEMQIELSKEKGLYIDMNQFNELIAAHKIKSRQGAEKKFKGGLADTSEMSVRYHTATHLLHQALRDVLGDHVEQKGSNITPERLRFDFTHSQKMTDDEKQKVEDIVNEKIQVALPVNKVTLPFSEAEKTGAVHFFGEKYGDMVNVYYIGNSLKNAYSKEFCGGPHVSNTKELGCFKIKKEEANSAGVRRIKAVLETS